MAKYQRIVTTEAGLQLLAAAVAGGTVTFTAVKTGSGIYTGTEELSGATDLKSVRQTFSVSSATRTGAQLKLRSVSNNDNLTEGYSMTEIGLYAKNPDTGADFLYAIIVAELADYLPAYDLVPASITLELYIELTEAESGVTFTAEVIEGAYVPVESFNDHVADNVIHITAAERSAWNAKLGTTGNVSNTTSAFTEATTLAALTTGSKLSVLFGALAKAVNSLISHLANKSNPHGVTKAQVGLGNVDNTSDANKPVSTAVQAELDKKALAADLTAHAGSTDNPHSVTKAQVGLSNVDNTSDANKPISTAAQAELNKKALAADLTSHTGSTSNPHSVTKTQVGLGNVPNVATNDQTPSYTAATSLAALASGEKLSVAFGKLSKAVSDLISHLANKSNPHGVTKAQIGLGSVDNTSDVNKPVSTAVQTELDKKALAADLTTHIGNTSNPHGVTKTQVGLGNVPNVATNDQTPTYTEATSNAALVSGEKLSVAFGKIAKAVSTVNGHIANTGNPHSVTKAQVGLSNVPNVATNDQTPTYTVASANAALTSGEKLSVALGKIAKAVSSLIAHLSDSVSHITAAERTKWNAKMDSTSLIGYVSKSGGSLITVPQGEEFCIRTYYDSTTYGDNIFEGFGATLLNGTVTINPGSVAVNGGISTGAVNSGSITLKDASNGFLSTVSGTSAKLCGETLQVSIGSIFANAPMAFHSNVKNDTDATSGKLLHTGISAPVVVSVNEPADTAALWVDTSVMALKIYKNGSWTVIR